MEKISVIIPTYNGAAFIAEAVQSIFNQTYPVHEIIVVDDGSTDKTTDIIKNYPGNITLIENKHKGNPAFGRNIGIEKATGDFIAFLDQDDLWPENKLEIQLASLQQKPSAMVDFGKVNLLDQQNELNRTFLAKFLTTMKDHFLPSSGLFRKEAFDIVGKFDETLTYHGSDTDWIARAIEKGITFSKNEEITFIYRIHDGNYSNNLGNLKHGLAEVIMKSIFRRKNKESEHFEPFPKIKIV